MKCALLSVHSFSSWSFCGEVSSLPSVLSFCPFLYFSINNNKLCLFGFFYFSMTEMLFVSFAELESASWLTILFLSLATDVGETMVCCTTA